MKVPQAFKSRNLSLHQPPGLMVLLLPGLAKPELHLNKGVVREGEEITARCSAPDEMGSIFFYFYVDSNEVDARRATSNQAEVRFHLSNVGFCRIYCRYTVLLTSGSLESEVSNRVNVTVTGSTCSRRLTPPPPPPPAAQTLLFLPQSCRSHQF